MRMRMLVGTVAKDEIGKGSACTIWGLEDCVVHMYIRVTIWGCCKETR